MSDILCVYYSRTGKTEKAMTEIAQALDAELVKIEDGQDRSKLRGYWRSGLEAMSKKLCPIKPLQTERPLQEYRLVIIGTPRLGRSLLQPRQELFGAERREPAAGVLRAHPRRLRPLRRCAGAYGHFSQAHAPDGCVPAAGRCRL